MFVEVELTGGGVGPQANSPDVHGVGVATHRHAQFEPARQRLDAAERPVLRSRLVRLAPLPLCDVTAEAGLQFVQRPRQRRAALHGAGFRRRRAAIVATARVVALEHAFQRVLEAARGQRAFPQRVARVVLEDAARQLPLPGPQDQRRGALGRHRAVEGLQLRLRRRGQRMRRLGLAQPRQQHQRGERLLVGLHRCQVLDGVLGPRPQHLLDALLPVGQGPFAGDVVRIVRRGDALVGGGDPAARRVGLARRLVGRDPAGPVVARVPARRRHQAAEVVFWLAHGNAAGRDEADVAATVGDHHVLHRRHERPRGVDEGGHRGGVLHHPGRAHRVAVGVERGPAHGQRVAGLIARAQHVGRAAGVRDHRPVARAPPGHGDVGTALDLDDLSAGLERRPAVGGAVAAGVGGIDLLQVEVLDVGSGVGEAPGDVLVLPQHHHRQARQRCPSHFQAGGLEAREVPQRGRAELEVRVVGQQRPAGAGVRPGDDPVVGAHALDARRRGDLGQPLPGRLQRTTGQPEAAEQRRVVGGGRQRLPRVGRQQLVDARHRHLQCQAQPQQLGGPVGAQVPGHHDAPGQAVDGVPGLGLDAQDHELRRPRAQLRAQHGVDARGVGLQRGA